MLEEIDQMVIGTPSGDAMPPVMLLIGIGQPQPDDTLDSLIARTPPVAAADQLGAALIDHRKPIAP